MSTRSQLSVATDADVEDGLPADVGSEKQLSMSQLWQMVCSLLLMCWKVVVHRAMAAMAQYQMAVVMLMIMMFAAAVDTIIMKNVAAAAAAVVTSAASAVVVVIPEAFVVVVVVVVVVVRRLPAMDSSATMLNYRGFRVLRSCL